VSAKPNIISTIFDNLQYAGQYSKQTGWHCVDTGAADKSELIQFAFLPIKQNKFEVRFKAYGSIELYAAAELLCRQAHQKDITQLKNINIESTLAILNISKLKSHLVLMIKKNWRNLLEKVEKHANQV